MIQWFPGHMAKARREIEEKLSLVDIVIELVDARAPLASQNPMLQEVIKNKPKIIILMKRDLADPKETEKWVGAFASNGLIPLAIHVNDRNDLAKMIEKVREIGHSQQQRSLQKGIRKRAVRALIAGIPNVGKSTLINRLANKKIAQIGDRPGVTKKQQWIKIKNQFELLDTPGILWPKFEDQITGMKLAAIGTIKYEVIPTQDVAAYLLNELQANYPTTLHKRYQLDNIEDMWEAFIQIGKRRGALESGGQVNMDKVAEIILQDFRSGKLGQISLERVIKSV